MAAKKYPLDPLLEMREEEAERATKALAEAVGARESAEHAKRAAEDTKRRAEEEAGRIQAAEEAKLVRGELTVGDLMRKAAWATGVAQERERLEQQIARADEQLGTARAAEGRARRETAARKAAVDVVEKDRGKWQARVRREADARDEEEAAEAWRPKRG
jgi:hypothetical protein